MSRLAPQLVLLLTMALATARGVPAQHGTSERVVVVVPAAWSERARPVLHGAFGDEVALEPVAAIGSAAAAGASIYLLWDEWTLARLAGIGALAPMARPHGASVVSWDPERRFALPFVGDQALAVAAEFANGTTLRTWEDLALQASLHDRLGLVAPEVDGGPWLSAMRHELARGAGEVRGLALWTTLDARAGRLGATYASVFDDLAAGRLLAAVGPRHLVAAVVQRSAGSLRLQGLVGAGLSRLGFAVSASAGPSAHALLARMLEPGPLRDLAAVLDLLPAQAEPPPLPPDQALAWWSAFEGRVRARGRAVERLADWLDLVFGLMFLVAVALLWRSSRRTAGATGEAKPG